MFSFTKREKHEAKRLHEFLFFLFLLPRTRREFALPEAWISGFGSICKGKKRGGVTELFCLISLKNGMRGDGDSKKSGGEKEQERKALFAFGKGR